jgi:hypothetical protein
MAIKIRVKKHLEEITRYQKEKGEKYSPKEEFQKRITEHPTKFAFTMVSIPKVGLNPNTKYNTPAGVYFYPLTQDYYEMLIENQLPFVSNAPYCGLVELNWSDKSKWLIFDLSRQGSKTEEDLSKAIELIKKSIQQDQFTKIQDLVIHTGQHYNGYGYDGKIFDWTYFAAKQLAGSGTRLTIAWTKLLRQLGYIGLYDEGTGVIHPSEKTQLVCLEPSAYTTLNVYATPDIRVGSQYEKAETEWKVRVAKQRIETKNFWKRFAALPPNHPEKIYRNRKGRKGTLYTGDIKKYIPLSSLANSRIEADITFDEGDAIPDNLTVIGNISAEAVISIGKNLVCSEKFRVGPSLDSIPEGLNLSVDTLAIRGGTIKTIPSDIKMKILDLSPSDVEYLPDNLTIPENLRIAESKIERLPENLTVGGNLYTGEQFAEMTAEATMRAIPNSLKVKGDIIGFFLDDMDKEMYMPRYTLEQLRERIRKGYKLKETFNRWKQMI